MIFLKLNMEFKATNYLIEKLNYGRNSNHTNHQTTWGS